jgi:hypothetical protein
VLYTHADYFAVISIVSIICEVYGVLGYACGYSIHFAEVYLEAIDFISISFALYGLIVFYGLTKEELTGRRPLAKFLSIKLIVMFTFYQGFVVSYSKVPVEICIDVIAVQCSRKPRKDQGDSVLDIHQHCGWFERLVHLY